MNAFGNMGASDPRLYDASSTLEAQNAAILAERMAAGESVEKANDAIIGFKEEMLVEAIKSGKRAFVSPSRVKGSYMVRPGKLTIVYAGTEMPVQAGAPAVNGTETRRIGDIKAKFEGNVLIIDPSTEEGAVILEWAEKHPEICRDALNPETEIWAAFKKGQLNLADKEPSIPTNMDIDKVMRGDYSGFSEKESIAARARKRLVAENNAAAAGVR